MPQPHRWPILASIALLLAVLPRFAVAADPDPIAVALREALGEVDRLPLATGVLYDRALPLSGIERFDGTPSAAIGNLRALRQAAHELVRASGNRLPAPSPESLKPRASGGGTPIPIALLDVDYERLRPGVADALRGGRTPEDPFERARAFLAAAKIERTYQGRSVAFVVEPDDLYGNDASAVTRLEIDPGDGGGFRRAAFGEPVAARYTEPGTRTVHVRLARDGGPPREAAFSFTVVALAATVPDDTLHVTASEPWQGQYGSGRAYVRYGRGHSSLIHPIVAVEGFDLDNTMSWDELYAMLNGQGLADTLWSRGHDLVVLDFDEATAPMQENGLVAAELVRQVAAAMPPSETMFVVGASMGGLCSRYALAHLERLGETPRVRTWLSFDTPHLGANLPLGIQYWLDFFSGQSADAAHLLSRLDTPAARQMLVYHHTSPPSSSPAADPLRAAFVADLAAEGDWPATPRRVAVANGSGTGAGQGFAPGGQIIRWEYGSLLADIVGNVWALPDGQPQTNVFDGRIRILFSDTRRSVPVSGTLPYDNAPGGRRATMMQMDTTAAPYGDIVALHPKHCFIPTVSAIALPGAALFTPVLGNPQVPAATPFAAVHVPAANEDHVAITPANAAFVLSEIQRGAVSAPVAAATSGLALAVSPQPIRDDATITFALPTAASARLAVIDIAGRTVRVLREATLRAGDHRVRWDGTDSDGRRFAPGLYFLNLYAGDRTRSARVILAY